MNSDNDASDRRGVQQEMSQRNDVDERNDDGVAEKAQDSHLNNNYKMIMGTGGVKGDNNGKAGGLPISPDLSPKVKDDPEVNDRPRGRIGKFVDGIKADLKNTELLPLKILFFFKYSTMFVLYPFMPLHLKSLGLTATEAGINSAIIPIFVILAPPFSGIIADKIGNFKLFLTGLTILNAPLALALLLVPTAREVVTLPSMLTLTLSCNPSLSSAVPYSLILNTLDPSVCQVSNDTLNLSRLPPTTLHCGEVCEDPEMAAELPIFSEGTASEAYRLVNETLVFTPFTSRKAQLACSSTECTFGLNSNLNAPPTEVTLRSLKLLDVPTGNLNMPRFGIDLKGLEFGRLRFNGSEKSTCRNDQSLEIKSPRVNCSTQCILQVNRSLICENKDELKVYNVRLTFGFYTLFRVILGVVSATSFIMFEGAVLAILKEHGGDYGLQRVFATLAAIIFAPLSGTLTQIFHSFSPAFYLYAILQVLSAIITLKIDLRFKRPTEKILGHLKDVLTQVEIIIFFVAMLLSGTAWGYLESFLFWYLEDLKANNVLMGMTIAIGGVFGIPVLIMSRPLIKRYGHVNMLCAGLAFYGIRMIGYSVIENPWFCLPFEAMEAVTTSLAITAAATYAASLASAETIASIQGIWGGLYFGFGRGAGSLMGGYFMRWFGSRNTFRIFSGISFVGAILYFIINITYIEKYSKYQRKTGGLDMSDIRGNREKRAIEAKQNGDSAANKNNSGHIGPLEVNFDDVPLDEETHQRNKSTNDHENSTIIKRKGDTNFLENSSV